MKTAYLKPQEAANHLDRPLSYVHTLIATRRIPVLRVKGQWRVEAHAVDGTAPDPVPPGQSFSIKALADHFRVSEGTIRSLLADGDLAGECRSGRIQVSRRSVVRFIVDNTIEVGDAA